MLKHCIDCQHSFVDIKSGKRFCRAHPPQIVDTFMGCDPLENNRTAYPRVEDDWDCSLFKSKGQ